MLNKIKYYHRTQKECYYIFLAIFVVSHMCTILPALHVMQQQEEFYKSLIIKAKVHKIVVCTEYDYCADVEIINGKTVYKNLRAIGKRFEERSIPIYIKRRNFPLFKLCDKEIEFTINGAYKTTAIWEYKSTYVGDDGRKHLWKDSENYYYGEEPPEKTEYSRWIIYGIVDGKRRFMEQVKE